MGGKLDSRVFRGAEQTVNYCLRGIRYREDSPVLLRLEANAALLEPSHRVARLKKRKRPAQSRGAAGIKADQLGRVKTGVGDVATPAAGDADFGEEMAAFLENDDAQVRSGFGAGDGGEKTGGAAADDDDVGVGHEVKAEVIVEVGCASTRMTP